MDMASLPPRKRPWHDGPGTSEHREMEAPGGPSEDRGGKGRGGPGPSQRVPKSGRSSSLDGDHHDGYHRDEPFGVPPGSGTPSRGVRSGSNWGRGSNMNSGPPRRGASRGGGRGR
nr:WD repeat domain 33 [Molossus molossus]